jgi:hypothetical protein
MGGNDRLAAEMAEALANTFPRIRISQLEPVQAVARGVFALIDMRAESEQAKAGSIPMGWLVQREIGIKILAECLATWQAESMEAKIDKWLSADPRRLVEFDAHGCVLTDENCNRHSGEASTTGEALGKALDAFDSEGTPDE